jgi:hypothetical protein
VNRKKEEGEDQGEHKKRKTIPNKKRGRRKRETKWGT